MSKRVLKWMVPVDDQVHPIGWGRVVLTECQEGPEYVTVWTEESDQIEQLFGPPNRPVQVYGTGHDVPDEGEHIGSTMALGGKLVWHVYGLPLPQEPS